MINKKWQRVLVFLFFISLTLGQTSSFAEQSKGGEIPIDQAWLTSHGPAPYLLTGPHTTYRLETDLQVEGTAFVITAPQVTLDLNGHTVIYGDSTPIILPNGGFEEGTSATEIPHWDLSQAPSALRVPARSTFWGKWMLQIGSFTSLQSLLSESVQIPTANHEYAAVIALAGIHLRSVQLKVLDSATGELLATGSSTSPNQGQGIAAFFTPSHPLSVRLKLEITPESGKTASLDLDNAGLFPSRDYGVVATGVLPRELPGHLSNHPLLSQSFNQPPSQRAVGVTLKNGKILQGKAEGYASSPLFFRTLAGLQIEKVETKVLGFDTLNLEDAGSSNVIVRNSQFFVGEILDDIDNLSHRQITSSTPRSPANREPVTPIPYDDLDGEGSHVH